MVGDSSVRVVDVYVRAGLEEKDCRCSSILSVSPAAVYRIQIGSAFEGNLPERLDRLIGEQRMPPVVVAFPDCFTRLGGNQYINSESMGPWEDFLLDEMLPAIEQRFGYGGSGRRGVFGKSSGGMARSHMRFATPTSGRPRRANDMGFELCYLPDMPAVLGLSPARRTPSSVGGSSSKPPEAPQASA